MQIKIKLVIWDLDNTLWRGTLAEGDTPALIPERAEIIKNLTAVGVVNSICSKNNFEQAQKLLREFGLWEYFIFPKISFEPKGQMVQSILQQMHLRAENTLFFDDEPSNLQEVSFYNPGINALHESNCEKIFSSLPKSNNPTPDHPRLQQYKQLERKTTVQDSFSDNEDFLRSSDIRLEFAAVSNQKLFERLCELTERTNQLNFTKNRMSPQDLLELLKNPNVETKLIHAVDNFGDYGFIGFYSLYQRNLIHFVFSCRIMNMGIENFVYEYLGYPKIKVVGDTASKLSRSDHIDYIRIVSGSKIDSDADSIEKILTEESQINIFALGACDLFHPIAYFSLPNNYLFYECNVFLGNERGVNVGTEYIRSQCDMSDDEKNFCRRHFHNYTRSNVFKSRIFDGIWDYVIISFHDDLIYKTYVHRDNPNLRVSLDEDPEFIEKCVINVPAGTKADWLKKNFTEGQYITPERFEENLLWISSKLPEKTKIVLINGPTMDFFREKLPHCPAAREQIFKLNEVMARICETHADRFCLVDINSVIRSMDDITNYIFHLKAHTAFNLFVSTASAIVRHFYPPPIGGKPCMLHKVLDGRKVKIFGSNVFELLAAYYGLLLGGVENPTFTYHKVSEVGKLPMKLDDFSSYVNQSEKYFIVVADNKEYPEIRELLIQSGYNPLKDFVQFKPTPYTKVWRDG